MFSLQLFFKVAFILYVFNLSYIHAQECPKPPDDPNYPCIPINDWNDLVTNVTYSGAEVVVLCPFNISKPIGSGPLVIVKAVTVVCSEVGKCAVNAAPFNEKGIIKIKRLAKVSMYGFAFYSSGTVFNTTSAIHVTFSSSMKQIFCNCFFKGHKGNMRGTALRTERQTNVDLVDCKFEENSSNDIGSIFNRGTMTVINSVFKNNSGDGGAIGSSRNSNTILAKNLFLDSYNGVTLFTHQEKDFVDLGGNNAINNAQCDGIFIHDSKICDPFDFAPNPQLPKQVTNYPSFSPSITSYPSLSPSTIQSPVVAKELTGCERVTIVEKSSCITVDNFTDFTNHVEQASGTIIFCPLKIMKKPLEKRLKITTDVQIICMESGGCHIVGSKRQIQITGLSARVYFQGFVFESATINAIHILSDAPQPQSFCNCQFLNNQGQVRGVGLLAEKNTIVEIAFCVFENNMSNDLAGSLFNRGEMHISDSLFRNNVGEGGSIGNAPNALMALKNNIFQNNQGGVPIFFHTFEDQYYTDLGGNLATRNGDCDGIWIDWGGRRCLGFRRVSHQHPTFAPINSPAQDPSILTTISPRGGNGYFNYDSSDIQYGPNGWGNVKNNTEDRRFQELLKTLNKHSLVNKCEWKNINQSPIDLCEDKINRKCSEYHQTRTHSGNIKLGEQFVTAQILPSKLRLKYYPDRPPAEGPYPPEADFAFNWHGYAEVNHIDVKIPSEHTLCGVQHPAELSIFMVHPDREQTIVMSILLAFEKDDKDNDHLQKAIDEWQKVYNANDMRCKHLRKNRSLIDEHANVNRTLHNKFDLIQNEFNFTSKEPRNLVDKTPFGRGGWDPFNSSLVRTIYHWGYWGSLTEPPCSTFVAWRILTEPAFISKRQLEQMKNILFSNQEDCEYTSVNHKQSVARPIQPNLGRQLYKCTVDDYVSDDEKKEMRKKTGNPNWCC